MGLHAVCTTPCDTVSQDRASGFQGAGQELPAGGGAGVSFTVSRLVSTSRYKGFIKDCPSGQLDAAGFPPPFLFVGLFFF